MSYKTEIKYKKRINLDSIFLSENVDKSNYVYNLTNPIKNVTKISLVDISYPNTGTYNITDKNNTLTFRQLLSDAEVTDITLLDNKKVVLNVEKKINWIDEKIAEKDRKDIWFLNNQFRPTNSDVGIVFDNVYKLTNSDVENKDSPYKTNPYKISTNICYNCGKKTLIFDDGMKRCTKCGYTNGVILDMQQEWRYYGAEDSKKSGDPTRCGMPTSSLFASNAFGAVLKGYGNERYRRLLKWNSIQYKAKSRMIVFKLITDTCTDNNIPYTSSHF